MTITFNGRIEALMTVPLVTTIAATNGGGSATVTIPADDYYPTELAAALQAALNATTPLTASWTVSLSTTTGLVSIGCGSTPFSIAWTSTTLRDLLGFTADITAQSTTQTGTKQARGLFLPDCPFMLATDPRSAPIASDLRTTTSPTGALYALFGNFMYQHKNVSWSHVPGVRIWEGLVTTANSSWEYFFNETQLGRGSSWFRPASRIQIYDHSGNLVGQFANAGAGTAGWWITGLSDIAPKEVVPGSSLYYSLELPELVSDG